MSSSSSEDGLANPIAAHNISHAKDIVHVLHIKNGTVDSIKMYVASTVPPAFQEGTVTASLPTLQPALPATVQLSLTIVYIVMFALIFFLVYIQLWMIWHYRHKRLSHQTLFLFMCLIWAGLRTSLFSFYFNNCQEANHLSVPLYWLLYSFPVCLQFAMLCLLLHFFAQVVLKARTNYEPTQYKFPLRIFLVGSVLGFMAVNLACAIVSKQHESVYATVPLDLLYVRVVVTETMFFIYGILLSVCIFKMTKMASTQSVLEAKGTTVRKALVATIVITLLFLSRTVYNLISICPKMKAAPNFGYDWINVTDQADAVPQLSKSLAYVSFGLVLFVWEVLPISIVVIFFRVRRLSSGQVLTDFSSQSHGSRVFFFDNPRRYDSEDDLSVQAGSSQYLDVAGTRSLIGDNTRSFTPRGTPRGTPINSSLWGPSATSPSRLGTSTTASSLPSSTSSQRPNGYGAISRGGYVPAHASINKP